MKIFNQFAGILAIGAAAAMTMVGAAQAQTVWDYNLSDNYLGCRYTGNDSAGNPKCDSNWSNKDVIGSSSDFDITSVKVNRTISGGSDTLTVDVFNTLVDQSGSLFGSYTDDPSQAGTQTTGIGYGDLFLSAFSDTMPYTGHSDSSQDFSGSDPHQTWTHALSFREFGDRYDGSNTAKTSGEIVLYEIANVNDAIFLSDDFMTGATYRNGQEVAVDQSKVAESTRTGGANAGDVVVGSWEVLEADGSPVSSTTTDGILRFMLDINNTELEGWTGLALKWSYTCANDSIEAFDDNAPVPEPAALALLGLGLVSMGVVRRRRVAS